MASHKTKELATCIHAKHFDQLLAWIQLPRADPKKPRVAFLFGPPGSGKTTLAHRAVAAANLRPVECNASQFRHKAAMSEIIEPLINSTNVTDFFRAEGHRNLGVILDEIDGMSTGEKGGLSELVRIIKAYTGANSIICISNEWQEARFKELTRMSLCLHITPPAVEECVEWIGRPLGDVEPLWSRHSGDLRKIYQDSKYTGTPVNRIVNPETTDLFAVRFFNGDLPVDEETTMVIKDINILGLKIHETLPAWIKGTQSQDKWKLYRDSLRLLVTSDRYDYYAFFHQHWSLFNMIFRIKIQMLNRLLLKEKRKPTAKRFTEIQYTSVLSKQSWLFNQFKYLCELRDALYTTPLRDGGLESALAFAATAATSSISPVIKADRYERILKKLAIPEVPPI
jgi:RecA/RadA recombinase